VLDATAAYGVVIVVAASVVLAASAAIQILLAFRARHPSEMA
jgi:hypothetical protein